MITTVIKYSGESEPFSPEKINKLRDKNDCW